MRGVAYWHIDRGWRAAARFFGRRLTLTGTVLVANAFLASCASLPSAGPQADTVGQQQVSVGLQRYVLVDVQSAVLDILARRTFLGFRAAFGDYRPAPRQAIGVGDTVSVVVYEAAPGGLFSSSSPLDTAGGSGARTARIPDQTVGSDGGITVPYAGRIRIVGLTTPQVERLVVARLQGKAIQPEAIVTLSRTVSNAVTLTGEGTAGARLPLDTGGNRLLEVIGASGGIRTAIDDTNVELIRGARTVSVPFNTVLHNPSENIYLRAGDVITLVRNPPSATVFGATGANTRIPLGPGGMTLEQLLATAGGLQDQRADPSGVFLLRFEPVATARLLDPTWVPGAGETIAPVIYRLNLRDVAGYFLARQFQVRDKDVVFVASAPINELQKVLALFSTTVLSAQYAAQTKSFLR